MGNLVLIRHGESICNANNIFTGWLDSPLTDKGKNEAVIAGKILEESGYKFDIGFTSVLCRAQETLNIILKELKNENIHIEKNLFLNERHYGSLEGMNKDEARNIFGSEMVQQWRRGLTEGPPKISLDEYDKLVNDPKYKGVSTEYLPFSENLDDVNKRTIKYFKESIEPHLKNGKNVIIVAHQNSIRSLIYYLEKLPDDEMLKIETGNCVPISYILDQDLNILNKHIYNNEVNDIKTK